MSFPASDADPSTPAAPDGQAHRSPTVLLVEDDPIVGQAVQRTLRTEGFDLRWTRSLAEARKSLASERPDLAIIDLQLEDGSGLDLCREIRLEWDSLAMPIIVMTGMRARQLRMGALEAGADEFVAKPVTPVELLLRVRNMLRTQALHAQVVRQNQELEQRVEERTRHLQQTVRCLEETRDSLRQSWEGTLSRLSHAAEHRDPETGYHLERMSSYVALLAQATGLSDHEVDQLKLASPLHDVGKIGVPDHILLKPGPLTEAEWEVMREHTVYGHRMLSGSGSPLINLAAEIALCHHERWDGTGYPHGLKGEAIPLSARITALADVFDALTSRRPYKRAFTVDESLAILHQGAGSHFDPELVQRFADMMPQVLEIMESHTDPVPPNDPRSPASARA